MKHLLLSLLVFSLHSATAVIHTVCNDPQRPAMYTTIQAAVDAAQSGDTVFIYGSQNSYSGFNANKTLYIYGNGINPDTDALPTMMGTQITFGMAAENSVLEGIQMISWNNANTLVVYSPNLEVRNCQLERVNIGHNPLGPNASIVIKNCVIKAVCDVLAPAAIRHNVNTTFEIHNSVIECFATNPALAFAFSNPRNAVVQNNVIIYSGGGGGGLITGANSSNSVFGNNIFLNLPTLSSECDYCAFAFNLASGCTECDLVTGTQSGTNNIFADPIFASWDGTFNLYETDLKLQAGSPGVNAGSDGTDIGVYGGEYPFIPGTYYNQMLTFQPYFTHLQLVNPYIPVQTGGPLEIEAGAIIFTE